MKIFVEGKEAFLKKGTSFEFIAENRLFSGSDEYTLSITFPIVDCPRNRAIFGLLYRKDVDIEKVNVGFMAIRVNAGTNVKIEFKYRTPGLFLGMAITVVCVLLFALYMVLMRTIFKEVPVPLARHNMVLRPLSHYAKKHGAHFENSGLIHVKPRSQTDRALEKKEGFDNDD